jgi:hypothetical protein
MMELLIGNRVTVQVEQEKLDVPEMGAPGYSQQMPEPTR